MAFVTCATYTAEQAAQDAAIAAKSIAIQEEGAALTASATSINFVGSGVTATNVAGAVTVTVATPASVSALDEGVALTSAMTSIDFTGAGVVATNTAGAVTVTVIKPTALAHTWDASGDGSGTITLTFSDGSTLTAPIAAIPATC